MKLLHIAILALSFSFIACSGNDKAQQADSAHTESAHPAQTGNGQGSMKAEINSNAGRPVQSMGAQPSRQESHSTENTHLNTGGLQWTTFDKLAKAPAKGDKKYLVDVYTEWCGWCKVMDKKTFTDPEIQNFLKDNFHIVKFDAEQKSSVSFNGKQYEWMQGGRRGVNKLALELLGNRLSYPTLVYLDENMNKITASPGYKTPEQLMAELKAITGMKS